MLDARFREVLGRSPIRYVTEWRMHLAEDLLVTTDLPVAAIGRRVGYDAEEAFSRAFKRSHGAAPSVWRSKHPTALTSNPVEHASGSRVWTPASVSLDPWQARHASGSTYDWSSSSSG